MLRNDTSGYHRRPVTRRRFVAGASAGVMGLAALTPGRTHRDAAAAEVHLDWATYDRAAFTACLGRNFLVPAGTNRIHLRLLATQDGVSKVQQPTGAIVPAANECFTLEFVGPHDPALPQGTYQFELDGRTAFALFIVPGRADPNQRHYLAVINRLS